MVLDFVLTFFYMKFLQANRIAPDIMPCFVASHLGLYCLPMFHKKDAKLIVHDIAKVLNCHHANMCMY